MERISEYDLDKELMSIYAGGQLNSDIVRLALQELKKRRGADHLADAGKMMTIKEQLRLVRAKCPDVWRQYHEHICPAVYDLRGKCDGAAKGIGDNDCKECWDKALEGEE